MNYNNVNWYVDGFQIWQCWRKFKEISKRNQCYNIREFHHFDKVIEIVGQMLHFRSAPLSQISGQDTDINCSPVYYHLGLWNGITCVFMSRLMLSFCSLATWPFTQATEKSLFPKHKSFLISGPRRCFIIRAKVHSTVTALFLLRFHFFITGLF